MKAVLLLPLATACGVASRVPQPRTVPEPTGWSVCYEADGTVDNYDGECSAPALVKWNLPATVYIPPDYPERNRVLQAMGVWNDHMGTAVFKESTGPAANVVITMAPLSIWGFAGLAEHTRKNGITVFTVTVFQGYFGRADVITHELGHTLGLAHDPGNKRSIMYPSGNWVVPGVTKADCQYLKDLYSLRVECR